MRHGAYAYKDVCTVLYAVRCSVVLCVLKKCAPLEMGLPQPAKRRAPFFHSAVCVLLTIRSLLAAFFLGGWPEEGSAARTSKAIGSPGPSDVLPLAEQAGRVRTELLD